MWTLFICSELFKKARGGGLVFKAERELSPNFDWTSEIDHHSRTDSSSLETSDTCKNNDHVTDTLFKAQYMITFSPSMKYATSVRSNHTEMESISNVLFSVRESPAGETAAPISNSVLTVADRQPLWKFPRLEPRARQPSRLFRPSSSVKCTGECADHQIARPQQIRRGYSIGLTHVLHLGSFPSLPNRPTETSRHPSASRHTQDTKS